MKQKMKRLAGKMYQWDTSAMGTLAWMVIALVAPNSPLKVAVSAMFMLVVPGYFTLRLIRGDRAWSNFWESLSYSVGLSALYMMVVGLLINTVLPIFGDHQPLQALPLVIGMGAGVLLILSRLVKGHMPLWPEMKKPKLSFGGAWLSFAGLATIAMSILGAISLNNGSTNAFSIIMLTMICGLGIALPWIGKHMTRFMTGFVIYSMSLAMLFATSLRGWFITGHDIVQEYQVFELTNRHALWSMNFLHDPYNACLSITILPTVLQRLTGLSDPYVFKILIQMVFALVPVIVYLLANKFVKPMVAAVVAFVFITFPTFMTDFPMLNRQEMAFLFFGLAFLTLFEHSLSKRERRFLIPLLFLGMVLSHYSSSYIAVAVVIAYKLVEDFLKIGLRVVKKSSVSFLKLGWPMVLGLFMMVYIWNVPLTNTAGQAESTVRDIGLAVQALIHKQTLSTSIPSNEVFSQYVNNAPTTRDLPSASYYIPQLTDQYPPVQTTATSAPLTGFGHVLSVVGVPISKLLDFSKTAYGLGVEGLIVMGLCITAMTRIWWKRPAYIVIGAVFLSLIVAEVLLPSAIDYGLLRLMQQSLVFLALPMVAAGFAILGWFRVPEQYRLYVLSAGFALGFALTSGLVAALTGGYAQSLVTSNSGFYYEAYYTHADELAGFNWLTNDTPVGSVVDSDEFARRKMIAYNNIYARTDIAPTDIANNAYFYLSYGDVTTNSMPHYYNGSLIYQIPPYDFLNATKNLVYSNGDVEIYR